MLRVARRSAVIGYVALVSMLLSTTTADAQAGKQAPPTASANCTASACDLSATSTTSSGGFPGNAVPVVLSKGSGSAPACSFVPLGGEVTGADGSKGYLYDEDCGRGYDQGMLGGQALPMWLPAGKAGPVAPAVSPVVVAHQAYTQLKPPPPVVAMSPSSFQVVGVPTWLWIDAAGWTARSTTASVPGVTVTATATPVSVVWDLGDGGPPVVCSGPGTPFTTASDPTASSPDCGYTYRRESAGGSGVGAFTVSASVHWRVAWQAKAAGQQGVFPDLVSTGSVRVTVREVQTLVVRSGG